MSSTFIESGGSKEIEMQKALDIFNNNDEIVIDNATAFDHDAVIRYEK